jgi:hypothetical protein
VGFVYYWVFGSIVWGYVSVLICFITVCDIFLIVLLCILSAAYYVSCDSFRKAVPDYVLVSLAVACVLDAFFKASRAFSIWIWRANISSALSMSRSALVGTTDIVTDVVEACLLSTYFAGSASFIVVCLLDSGISVVGVLSVASTDRSIRLLSTVVGILRDWLVLSCYSKVATSSYSYFTVVTIFVVLVVCGDSSSCSTHLSLFRRFSSLYPCFCSVVSISDVFCVLFSPVLFAYVGYFRSLSWIVLSLLSIYKSIFYLSFSSPARSIPLFWDSTSVVTVFLIPSTCCYRRCSAFPCVA